MGQKKNHSVQVCIKIHYAKKSALHYFPYKHLILFTKALNLSNWQLNSLFTHSSSSAPSTATSTLTSFHTMVAIFTALSGSFAFMASPKWMSERGRSGRGQMAWPSSMCIHVKILHFSFCEPRAAVSSAWCLPCRVSLLI